MNRADVVVIGGGIAGASAAAEIAANRSVVLLERESQPDYHTTGRSAALFSETYGNAAIWALSAASRAFYLRPPPGFTELPLLTPRGVVLPARPDQLDRLLAWAEEARRIVPSVRPANAAEVQALVPILRPGYVAGGVLEPDAMDIDVHALHQGYLRLARARGARIVTDAEVQAVARGGVRRHVHSTAGAWQAEIVVNAAGAWADVVAAVAGAAPVGLVPKRRTAMMLEVPHGLRPDAWSVAIDADEEFYFKPDAGRLLASPADETPMPPCDVQPDELDIAICIDRIQRAADLPVRRVLRAWAGLRSFAADHIPVVGFDDAMPGFFWLAGQGGYGIQTAPAMGRVAAALLAGRGLPEDVAARGVTPAQLAPARLRGMHQDGAR